MLDHRVYEFERPTAADAPVPPLLAKAAFRRSPSPRITSRCGPCSGVDLRFYGQGPSSATNVGATGPPYRLRSRSTRSTLSAARGASTFYRALHELALTYYSWLIIDSTTAPRRLHSCCPNLAYGIREWGTIGSQREQRLPATCKRWCSSLECAFDPQRLPAREPDSLGRRIDAAADVALGSAARAALC